MMKEKEDKQLINIGDKVYELRRKRGYSQMELAKILGMSNMTVSRIENGTTAMSILTLIKIAAALEVSVESILGAARSN